MSAFCHGEIVQNPKVAFVHRILASVHQYISSTPSGPRSLGHESNTITARRYIHLFDKQRTDEAVRQAMASSG